MYVHLSYSRGDKGRPLLYTLQYKENKIKTHNSHIYTIPITFIEKSNNTLENYIESQSKDHQSLYNSVDFLLKQKFL